MENQNFQINTEILSYVVSKTKKYNQVVWIPVQEYIKILELSDKFALPPNQIIAAIVVSFLRNIPLFQNTIVQEKIVEVPKKVPVLICYFCWQEQPSLSVLQEHLKTHGIEGEKLYEFVREQITKNYLGKKW